MKAVNEDEVDLFAKAMLAKLKDYKNPSYVKAVWQLCNTLIPLIGGIVSAYWSYRVNAFLFLLLCLLNAFFLMRLFVFQHDCGHGSFVKSRRLCDSVGFLCSLFSAIPYKFWAEMHVFHHKNTGKLDIKETAHIKRLIDRIGFYGMRSIGDIKTLTVDEYSQLTSKQKKQYRIYRKPLVTFLLGPLLFFLYNMRYPKSTVTASKDIYRSVFLTNVIIVGTLFSLCIVFDWKIVLSTYFISTYLFYIITFWLFYAQHQHEYSYKQRSASWKHSSSALIGATYFKLPSVLNWFSASVGVHHVHHLHPTIPNYNLLASVQDNPSFNQYTTIVTLRESVQLLENKLWDENKQKMISFEEFELQYDTAEKIAL
jgi:acyl-lipid omega-6 desaturase (Delta-12 desaturase)